MQFPPVDHNRNLIPNARKLRENATPQENHLWYDFLAHHRIRWHRQYPISDYIVDFYCRKLRIAVELDGSQHTTPEGIAYDNERTAVLETYGIQVIRFTNYEVDAHFTRVCTQIDKVIFDKQSQRASVSSK